MTRKGELGPGTLTLIYFATAAPFFLAGAIVSLVISETIQRVERVYFFDLMGASAGCFVLIPLLNAFGGPNTVIAVGILFAASAAIWFNIAGRSELRIGAVALSLALVGLIFINANWRLIDVTWAKGRELPHELFVKWNSFSRIGMAREHGSGAMRQRKNGRCSAHPQGEGQDRRRSENRRLAKSPQSLPYVSN